MPLRANDMPSGLVRLALAGAQNGFKKGKSGNEALARLVKSQDSMKNAYPIKSKKK